LTTTSKCIHHWLIEKPSGPFSIQTCKKCGETDAARNYLNDVGWSRREGTKMEDFADEEDRKLYLNEHLKEKIIEEKKNSHITPTKKIRVIATYEDDLKFKVLMDTDLFISFSSFRLSELLLYLTHLSLHTGQSTFDLLKTLFGISDHASKMLLLSSQTTQSSLQIISTSICWVSSSWHLILLY